VPERKQRAFAGFCELALAIGADIFEVQVAERETLDPGQPGIGEGCGYSLLIYGV